MIKRDMGNGIIQITLDEDRWYNLDEKSYPSVTWILDSYPKGYAFSKWLGDLPSFEESQTIMKSAGERGSKVHWGIETLLYGKPLSITDIPDGHYEPFSSKEWQYILNFKNWYDKYQPIIESIEQVVVDPVEGYGGTIDLVCIINNERWIIDWKTSANIYESYKCQIAAYAALYFHKTDYPLRMGIVRLGSRHKVGYEFWQGTRDEQIKYFKLFLHVKEIWHHEHGDVEPKTIDVPETLILGETNENQHKVEDISEQEREDQIRDESSKQKNGEGIS